jgi:hypothetical protein
MTRLERSLRAMVTREIARLAREHPWPRTTAHNADASCDRVGFRVLRFSCWPVPSSSQGCALVWLFWCDSPGLYCPMSGRVVQLVCNLVCKLLTSQKSDRDTARLD